MDWNTGTSPWPVPPGRASLSRTPGEILAKTIDACRIVVRRAADAGVELVAVALATQRSTAVLWDTATGTALVPAMVWQDSRHAAELAELGKEWDNRLVPSVGRPRRRPIALPVGGPSFA